jgi:hypothetical protein
MIGNGEEIKLWQKYSTNTFDRRDASVRYSQLLQLIKVDMVDVHEEYFPLSLIYIPSSMYTLPAWTHSNFSSIEPSANSLRHSTFLGLVFYYSYRMILYPSL